jgi:adenylylsulfate kinase
MEEKKSRSVTKALTYRILATIATFSVSYVFIGNFEIAMTIGLVDSIVKFVLFYVNERMWLKVRWGYRELKK